MRRASIINLGSYSSYRLGEESYDSSKLGLGPLMIQNNGVSAEDKWAGPLPLSVIRPMEYSTAIPGIFPWAMQWSSSASEKLDWVFLADNATAAATRRLIMATYNRLTGSFGISGFITLTFPTATNHTIRGLRMTYDKHTAGTVSVSGTAVSGTGTSWLTDGACVGNRIGFGSADPTQISTWYEIQAIGSDGSITLTGSAGTIAGGTAYVIEDLRAIVLTTNATTTNGGLFVAKGLRPELFIPSGTTIPAATTTDRIRAVYWLKDAATETNIIGLGLAIEPVTNKSSHVCWALDTTTNVVLFKYNLRAALTGLASGASTSAFLFKTGSGGALTGTASQANNGRYAVASHGPGSGSGCIYFTTTTRVYRTAQTSTITNGSTTFIADNMAEIPPGSANTYAASSLLNAIEYAASIDRWLVSVNATTTPFRDYLTQYRTDGGQFDRVTFGDLRQLNQSLADSNVGVRPDKAGLALSVWSENGMVYVAQIGTTAATNLVFAMPMGADWDFAASTNARVILPAISLSGVDKLVQFYNAHEELIGNSGLGSETEPIRWYYRTSGISDNSGSWTALTDAEDIGVGSVSQIQFMAEFRTIGTTHIPGRIMSIGLIWDDISTDSHYQFSAGKTSLASKQFAWRHSVAFGGSVPALRVRLYDATTSGLLVDDNTASPVGTFERSTDGTSWSAWSNSDKSNETNYVRYTPASLADSIKVQAVLTLN